MRDKIGKKYVLGLIDEKDSDDSMTIMLQDHEDEKDIEPQPAADGALQSAQIPCQATRYYHPKIYHLKRKYDWS